MYAIYSSETSVDLHQVTQRYTPDEGNLHVALCFGYVEGIVATLTCL
jgi:hypothetical protein